MADVESLFDFLHMEIVAYFHNKQGKFVEVSNQKVFLVIFIKANINQVVFSPPQNDAIQNLERLGFNVGQRIVERFVRDFNFLVHIQCLYQAAINSTTWAKRADYHLCRWDILTWYERSREGCL